LVDQQDFIVELVHPVAGSNDDDETDDAKNGGKYAVKQLI
jgi:hypothetical protein